MALLLMYCAWKAFRLWRKGVEFSKTLVPTLEQQVALPPPGPVLMWAVEWDLDIRCMVDDLKNEGVEAVERYCQNEAFMNKLTKIVRNVVSQGEMIRITQEVRMRRELEKFHKMNFQKSAEEEDADAKAWQAMMLEMTGEKPQQPQIDVHVGASAKPPQFAAQALEGDDAEALEAMMAVMNRKPYEEAAKPPIPQVAETTALNEDDAAALQAMMSVMNRKPFDETPPAAPAPVSNPAPVASFEGDDAAAWEAMLSVMNRKPFEAATTELEATPAPQGGEAEASKAMMSVMNCKPFETPPAPAPVSHPAPVASFEGDDAAAWEAMLSVMNRKPFEAAVPVPSADDAAALQAMMSAVDQTPVVTSPKDRLEQSDCSTEQVLQVEKSESEESDEISGSNLWAQLEEMEKKGISLQVQAEKLVSVIAPAAQLPELEEKSSSATHFFIGETEEEEERAQLEDFWTMLDDELCRGADILPYVQKLVDCFHQDQVLRFSYFFILFSTLVGSFNS